MRNTPVRLPLVTLCLCYVALDNLIPSAFALHGFRDIGPGILSSESKKQLLGLKIASVLIGMEPDKPPCVEELLGDHTKRCSVFEFAGGYFRLQ